jgi:hypothetical protein
MSFAITGAVVGIASAGVGIASAAGAFTPSQPNLGAASKEMANLQAEQLPIMNQLQAEAQLGGSVLTPSQQAQIDSINKEIEGLQTPSKRNGGTTDNSAAIQALQNKIKDIQNNKTSFAGYSTADIQKQLLGQQAQGQLESAQKFDPQFIAEAQAQEAQANPQGVAARGQLYQDIENQIANRPQSPVANTMDKQISERVAAGSGLTPEEQAVLDNSVNQSILGTSGNNPDLASALTTGFAGQERAAGNAQAGAAWLASGETPSDIQYRADQQNLSNLSSFINGQTPESQFGQLSGAQTGATPVTPAVPQQGANFNAGNQGISGALQQFSNQTNTPSNWTTGISGVLGAANTAAAAFNPIASPKI